MSSSSATGRIVSLSNGKSYHSMMQCDQGDINQFYSDGGAVTPSFGTNNSPMLIFMPFDSENAATPIDAGDGIVWTVNGVVLSFTSNVSTNKFSDESGHFVKTTKTVTYGSGDDKVTVVLQCLKVVKNLVNINDKSSFVIGASVKKRIDNTSVDLSASFSVTIAKGEIASRRVRIQSPSDFGGTPFTISKKYEKDSKGSLVAGCYCMLEAVAITTDVENGSEYTYEWAQQKAGGWSAVSGDASNPARLTVTEDMVDGSALFRCIMKKDGAYYGQDIQNVNDVSDPYQVYANCVGSDGKPAVEVSYRGSGVSIKYQPYVKTGDTMVAASRVKFRMKLFDSIGTQLNKNGDTYAEGQQPPFSDAVVKTEFEIPEAFITNHMGIDWEIDADITDK